MSHKPPESETELLSDSSIDIQTNLAIAPFMR
jgi:hypothetical protein